MWQCQVREEFIEGELLMQARGSGAAPFGIASGILTSSNTALNLGRLQEAQLPQALPDGDGVLVDEMYKVLVQFKLRPAGRNALELHQARMTYVLACNTRITYEAGSIHDHLRDRGTAVWEDGVWVEKPDGWDPQGDPRIDVTLEPKAGGFGRFEMEYAIVHPLTISGESTWKTPVSEISIEAKEGLVTYHGDSPFLKMQLPGQAGELMKGMRKFFDQLPLLDVDTRMDFGSELTLEGAYNEEEGVLLGADTYRNLTGAQIALFVRTGSFAPVLEPVDKAWLPGPDEEVTVRARVRGEKAPAMKWRYTLYEVTNERGACTNCPIESSDDADAPDLEFETEGSPFGAPKKIGDRSWQIETLQPEREVEVKVVAKDSGAWGRLKAHYVAGDEWVTAQVETDLVGAGAFDSITIPVDEQGGSNRIADSWEEDQGLAVGSDRRTDDDETPKSAHPGDGLTVYEEYRGFHEAGNLVRTKPREKDLFFYVEDGLDSKVRAALEPTGIRVHLVEQDEMVSKGKRIVNNNSGGYKLVVQHGLYVGALRLGGRTLGRACSGEDDCKCARLREELKPGDAPCDEMYAERGKRCEFRWTPSRRCQEGLRKLQESDPGF